MPELDRESLDELLRLEREAAPGPWQAQFDDTDYMAGLQARIAGPDGDAAENAIASINGGSDDELRATAALIPAMRNALVSLIELAEREGKAEARIAELERTLQEMPDERVSAWQLGAKLIAAQNRIAELERERDSLREITTWRCMECGAVQPFDYETFACLKCKVAYKLVPYHQWKREIAEAESARLTARNAELSADLKRHMHLVRTMGERCDVLGGLLGEWAEEGKRRAGIRIGTTLIQRTEQLLKQTETTQ